ncbi:MAG: radical SAM protein [Desulfobacterales bacterium]|jgi:MoaA/NifB/PqqE/SkfB family radical SAM enzyme
MRFNNFWDYRRILFSRGFASAVWQSRKNVLANGQGRPLNAGPYMAELDITYRCNCRCQMCQRWQDARDDELRADEYEALAAELHDLGSHQISIAGGEPLMRDDAFDIIRSFSGRGMSVNICTNGLLLEKYHNQICNSKATCVTVSLDGASADSHDIIRGAPGSYRQIEDGLQRLLQHRRSSRPIVRVRMTISNQNVNEMRAFYQKWDGVVDDVLFQPVHYCNDAYYTGMDENSLHLDPELISEQIDATPLANDGYLTRLIDSLKACGSFPQQQCYAAVLMARIDPWGNVYPCLEQHVSVGSIREADFKTIWNSKRIQTERHQLASDRACNCWYNNTALIGHYGNLLEKTRMQSLWDLARHNITCHVPAVISGKKYKTSL